jgi:hypothetical protein
MEPYLSELRASHAFRLSNFVGMVHWDVVDATGVDVYLVTERFTGDN